MSGKGPEVSQEEVALRPTLAAWLVEYDAIEREYLSALEATGIVFAPRGEGAERVRDLRKRLHERGARFMNGGASVSTGFLSSACAACVGDCGSRTFYINLRCTRDCYFCFNPNQADFEEHCRHDTPWRQDLEAFVRETAVTHVGLTGGEPLLAPDEALAFFRRAHELAPNAHLRLYTSGIGLDEAFCAAAAGVGLREVRFSVKLDEGEAAVEQVLTAIDLARCYVPDVMVEMPVVPGTLERMKRLLVQLDERGVRGINLLEFCYPFRNWDEFARRGLAIANPPFDVLYNYGYAGGLPVAGSEEACLTLVEYALDEGLHLGVHYCSLNNKNRDQILQANRTVTLDPTLYELGEDCFYHTAKVFDGDVERAIPVLRAQNRSFTLEEDNTCLTFHPQAIPIISATGALIAHSWNVVEHQESTPVVRELKLALGENDER